MPPGRIRAGKLARGWRRRFSPPRQQRDDSVLIKTSVFYPGPFSRKIPSCEIFSERPCEGLCAASGGCYNNHVFEAITSVSNTTFR